MFHIFFREKAGHKIVRFQNEHILTPVIFHKWDRPHCISGTEKRISENLKGFSDSLKVSPQRRNNIPLSLADGKKFRKFDSTQAYLGMEVLPSHQNKTRA